MDLTKNPPRSVHDKYQGIVQLGRTLDKAKALAHGNIGEYHYNCPMDQAVFGFLGIDHEQLLDVVKNAKSDADIEAFTKPYVDARASDLAKWNHDYVNTPPTGESLEYMVQLRDSVAPGRSDVTTWPDVLDLDEKRPVPVRVAS